MDSWCTAMELWSHFLQLRFCGKPAASQHPRMNRIYNFLRHACLHLEEPPPPTRKLMKEEGPRRENWDRRSAGRSVIQQRAAAMKYAPPGAYTVMNVTWVLCYWIFHRNSAHLRDYYRQILLYIFHFLNLITPTQLVRTWAHNNCYIEDSESLLGKSINSRS